jgi:hypothetical protein
VNKKLIAAPLIAILFLLTTTATPVLADGCFFPDSMYRDLYESAQKAVILFGNSTGNYTEHLILSVSFEGDAEDFAWVIPVPNRPEIAVTDAELFWELSEFTAAEVPNGKGGFGCFGATEGEGEQGGVDVIEEQVVGPYATAILSATNATALADWLNANGYVFPEDGEDIASEYIEKEWYFVATRINTIIDIDLFGYEEEAEKEASEALAEGAIEPIILSFASHEIVYPLRITSLSTMDTASPEVLLYVFTDHIMVPEQYPLYVGYGNWQENAFTLEFGDNVSIEDLPDYYEVLPELISTYLSDDEFSLTKLRGTVSADQMVDIRLLMYEGDALNSLTQTDASRGDIAVLATIIGPVFGLYLWRRRRRTIISRASK